jgi:hypothetical protein
LTPDDVVHHEQSLSNLSHFGHPPLIWVEQPFTDDIMNETVAEIRQIALCGLGDGIEGVRGLLKEELSTIDCEPPTYFLTLELGPGGQEDNVRDSINAKEWRSKLTVG